jgi:integrase
MPTTRLTDASVQRLRPPAGKSRADIFDAAMPGLCIRLSGERRTWCLFYRFGGKQKRLSLGHYPGTSLAAARAAANAARLQIEAGTDPAEAKATVKAKAARPPDTFENVVEQFIRLDLERRHRTPRYIRNTRAMFANHVTPRWRGRDIKSIGRRDLIELLDAVHDGGGVVKVAGKRKTMPGGPVIANRVLGACKAMFNWAARRGLIETSPATLVEKPGEETSRQRALSDAEIARVWDAAGALTYPHQQFYRLALITGQRRTEIATMRWDQIDFDAATWTLPAASNKAKREHIVPLSPLALALLRNVPRFGRCPFVLSADGEKPLAGFSKPKKQIDQLLAQGGNAIEPWTIHDLRRSAATGMAALGVERFVISRVLNHTDSGITSVYDRHRYTEQKRHALDLWAAHLQRLTGPQPPSNVVPLHAHQGA